MTTNTLINCLLTCGFVRCGTEEQAEEITQTLRRSKINMDQCVLNLDKLEIWLTL